VPKKGEKKKKGKKEKWNTPFRGCSPTARQKREEKKEGMPVSIPRCALLHRAQEIRERRKERKKVLDQVS